MILIGTFHKENPQSVASAIHIRRLTLRPRESLDFKLTDFEDEVYTYYNRFCRTKPLKAEASRPYLPHPVDLIKWPSIKRIVATWEEQMMDFSGPYNKKWQKKGLKKRVSTSKKKKKTGKGRKARWVVSDEEEESDEASADEEEEEEEEAFMIDDEVDPPGVLTDSEDDIDIHEEEVIVK
jgi:hypothetical protein